MNNKDYTRGIFSRGQVDLIKLKCDLHTHIIGDRRHEKKSFGMLTPQEFIDLASELDYQALSFTYHDYLYQDADIWAYAKQKEILLIPGIEKSIHRRHVLLLNCPHGEALNGFEEIRSYRQIFQNCLIIAPHPFYGGRICLGKKLIQNIDCFDAIEYCHFYTSYFNPNRKALRVARRFNLPMVGCSDAHRTKDFGTTYSNIYVDERSIDGVIRAVKAGRIENVTSPMPFMKFIKEILWIIPRAAYVLKGEFSH